MEEITPSSLCRPATGKAKARSEIQRDYRRRQRERVITLNVARDLATVLHAHLLAISEGRSMVIIEPDQAATLARLITKAEIQQLPGYVDRRGAKKKS